MAKLFLSYSRKDSARAQRFAEWLEREGHDVWRDDDDIGGGASFSAEIEKALNDSDAVIVLWSSQSVHSAWVRDEAAFGRDLGKLIPISIDGIDPPLGFRQFQSIDLSKWKGRGEPPAGDRVSAAIARISRSAHSPPPEAPEQRRLRPGMSRPIVAAAVAAIIVLAAAAAFLALRGPTGRPAITIAVMPSPSSPDRAAAADYANVAAADMAAFLPTHFDRAVVIAPPDANGRTSGNRMLISANLHGGGADASLTLSDADGHTILWSKSWSVPDASAVDLRQEISRSASQAALCLTEAKGGSERLVQPALGLFMNGCAGIGDSEWSDAELLAIFERVAKLAPNFPPGWAYLAIGRSVAAEGAQPSSPAVKSAREAIARARELNRRSGLSYLAEALLNAGDRGRALALLDEGAELEPDNALIQMQRADSLRSLGRLTDSVRAAKRAVELDPLSAFVRSSYISTLTYAGQLSRAREEIAEARKKWPNDREIEFAQFGFDYRYGDARAAESLIAHVLDYSDAQLSAYRKIVAARLDPSGAKVNDALLSWDRQARTGAHRNQYLLALGLFHKVDETYALLREPGFLPFVDPEILFRPEFAPVRADPRFMEVAARLGLVRYWRQSGNWPDFCATEQLRYDCKTEAAKYGG
jgi:tetratricopeptide (TPR) repeat protein